MTRQTCQIKLAIKPHIDTPYYVVDFDFVLAPK